MERVCRPGRLASSSSGRTTCDWLAAHGYRYVSFERRDVRRVREPCGGGRAHLDLLSRTRSRRSAATAAGGSRSSCWGSTRRATSPSRRYPMRLALIAPLVAADPRATARRLSGLRRRPRTRIARQGPRGAPLRRLRIGGAGRPGDRCRRRSGGAERHALPGLRPAPRRIGRRRLLRRRLLGAARRPIRRHPQPRLRRTGDQRSPPSWPPPSCTRSTCRQMRRSPARCARRPIRHSPPTVAGVSEFQASAWRRIVPVAAILPPLVPTG